MTAIAGLSLPGALTAERGTWKGAAVGAGAGVLAGAGTGAIGAGVLFRGEGATAIGLGALGGAAGGLVGGAITGAWGPIAGAVASIGIPVAAMFGALRMGGGGIPAMMTFFVGAPFAIGGLAGTAAGAALVRPGD